MFMKSVLKKFASFADVESDVCFSSYLKAPQKTTSFFCKRFFTSPMSCGTPSFASFPKTYVMKRAFIRVAEIPAIDCNFSLAPIVLKAKIYFRATLPPPQTIINLYFPVFFLIVYLIFYRKVISRSSVIIKLPPRLRTITFFCMNKKRRNGFYILVFG